MKYSRSFAIAATVVAVLCELVASQQSGSFNFAKKTGGEREGDLSPAAIAGVSIGVIAGLVGMVVTVFFCYFVYRKQKQQDSLNNSFDPARNRNIHI